MVPEDECEDPHEDDEQHGEEERIERIHVWQVTLHSVDWIILLLQARAACTPHASQAEAPYAD